MHKVKLISDSTSDLSEELIKKYDIDIIPLYVNFGSLTLRDNIDINPARLFERVKAGGILPTTAAPTPDDFKEKFAGYITQGMDIVCIVISSKFSSTYQNACTAAAQFPAGRIKVVDSYNLSTGIGLLVMTAADCIANGLGAEKTFEEVKNKIEKVQTAFILDTVEYLHKGGRCSGLQMFFSSLLRIHPVIKVGDGSMHLAAKIRGGRQQVLDYLLQNAIKEIDNIDPRRVFVTQAESREDALWLKNKLTELKAFEEILITDASCVISTHCGPKTVGILYLKK